MPASTARIRLALESGAFGLGFASLLCWASTCLVAAFRINYLASPYWAALPGLRTDTCGALAFVVTFVCLVAGKYLRLTRPCPPADGRQQGQTEAPGAALWLAIAETVAILATVLVAYLSLNAVTHPATLQVQATHFATWPTEGTLRILALAAVVVAGAERHYLRAGRLVSGAWHRPISRGAGTRV